MKIFIVDRGAGSAGVRWIDEFAEPVLTDLARLSRPVPGDVYRGGTANDRRRADASSATAGTDDVVEQLRKSKAMRRTDQLKEINLVGLSCTGSILQLAKAIKEIRGGQLVSVTSSDPLFSQEITTWCENTGNMLHYCKSNGTAITAVVQKYGRNRSGRRERLSHLH